MSERPVACPSGDHVGGIDPHSFKIALGRFATGVCVISAVGDDGEPAGVTVSAFASLSLTPPLILFCLDRGTTRLAAFRASGRFGISILGEGQRAVSELFASQRQDKFAAALHRMGANGCPLIDGAVAHLECGHVATHDGGDHLIFVGRVDRVAVTEGQPLLYYHGGYGGFTGIA